MSDQSAALAIDPRSTSLDMALWLYQNDPPTLVRDKEGQAGNQKTHYADLAQTNEKILSRLNSLGVTYRCAPTLIDSGPDGAQRFVQRWTFTHVPTGEKLTGDFPVAANENLQRVGSALSYIRRYVLLNVTNTAAEDEDDDGQAASGGARRASTTRSTRGRRADRVADDQNPPDVEPAADRTTTGGSAGSPTGKMQTKIVMQLKELGYNDRDDQLRRISKFLGRPISSKTELTYQEGHDLISALDVAIVTRAEQAAAGGPAPGREG